jgi:peptidyl-prolyl cis-trans isomerase D
MKEYESDTRNSLLTKKIISFFNAEASELELEAFSTGSNIRDRISYKVLTPDDVSINTTDKELKPFWESNRFNYMTDPQYTLETITVAITPSDPSESDIEEYYKANRHNFKDSEGKILPLEKAKEKVIAALDEKAANKKALKTYIAFKKNKLSDDVKVQTSVIDITTQPYESSIFEEITKLTPAQPYLKPRKVNDSFVVIKLTKTVPSEAKTYEAAKEEVRKQYVSEQKRFKLQELAENSKDKFEGITTDFISRDDVSKIEALNEAETTEFLGKMFESENKHGYITLSNQNIVLYTILEQKMLNETITDQTNSVMSTKSQILDSGLIKVLQEKYPTQIYVKGL